MWSLFMFILIPYSDFNRIYQILLVVTSHHRYIDSIYYVINTIIDSIYYVILCNKYYRCNGDVRSQLIVFGISDCNLTVTLFQCN